MSQQTQPVGSQTGSALARIVESLSSAWVQREQIKAGFPLGYYSNLNSTDQYQRVTTGQDYDGSTLVEGQWVSGVSNTSLLAGAAALAAVGIIAYAMTR